MRRHGEIITPEDSEMLAQFRDTWRAAGWGGYADCMIDAAYGESHKFHAALFTPAAHDEILDRVFEEQLAAYEPTYDLRRRTNEPVRSDIIPWMDFIFLPNLVYGATAAEVCLGAIRKASDLYPGEVPDSPAALEAAILVRLQTD